MYHSFITFLPFSSISISSLVILTVFDRIQTSISSWITWNSKGVWPSFPVWSPPWIYASSVKNKNTWNQRKSRDKQIKKRDVGTLNDQIRIKIWFWFFYLHRKFFDLSTAAVDWTTKISNFVKYNWCKKHNA